MVDYVKDGRDIEVTITLNIQELRYLKQGVTFGLQKNKKNQKQSIKRGDTVPEGRANIYEVRKEVLLAVKDKINDVLKKYEA